MKIFVIYVMARYLQIQIPNSCCENWEMMSICNDGRFCHACEKNVIDFSDKSSAEIVTFLRRYPGKLCGRFNPEQLNTDILIPRKKITWWKYVIKIALPTFLLSQKSVAREMKGKEQVQLFDLKKNFADPPTEYPNDKRLIEGNITDNNGNPIPFATIMVKGTKRGTAADANGNFSIVVKPDDAYLVISSVGYTAIQTAIDTANNKNITLERMTLSLKPVITGEVVVVRKRASRKEKKEKDKAVPTDTAANIFTIYPNPASTGSRLFIKWKLPTQNKQNVEIYDLAGTLVQSDVLYFNNDSHEQWIDLKIPQRGMYVIHVTDAVTGKSASQKFVAQ